MVVAPVPAVSVSVDFASVPETLPEAPVLVSEVVAAAELDA